jgi:hypothetical protein
MIQVPDNPMAIRKLVDWGLDGSKKKGRMGFNIQNLFTIKHAVIADDVAFV